MATRDTITDCLVILTAAYPRATVPPETAGIYTLLLADVDDTLLMAAVQHHAATSKSYPTVAELRSAVAEIVDRAEGLPTADEAWAEIVQKMRRYPPVPTESGYQVPDFSHPLILEAVNVLGGWYELGASENGIADRAHFFKVYPQLVARRREEAALLPAVKAAIGQVARRLALRDGRALVPFGAGAGRGERAAPASGRTPLTSGQGDLPAGQPSQPSGPAALACGEDTVPRRGRPQPSESGEQTPRRRTRSGGPSRRSSGKAAKPGGQVARRRAGYQPALQEKEGS